MYLYQSNQTSRRSGPGHRPHIHFPPGGELWSPVPGHRERRQAHTDIHRGERERERERERVREISEFQVPVRYRPLQWTLLWVLCTTCEWASSSVCDRLSLPTHTATYNHQLNNWSTVGPTMEEGPWRFKTIRGTTSNCNCNPTLTLTLTLTWHRLPPKSRGFLCGPRATLISSFVKTGWVFYFCVILPTNK